jgi:nitroreductase
LVSGAEKEVFMDGLELLRSRRSVRKFGPGGVEPAVLDRVLEAATFAPSGQGKQSAQVVVVRDAGTLEQLRRMNAGVLGSGSDPYYGAPVIVLVLAPGDAATPVEDGSCLLTYMMLAAHYEGLASVWVHREREMFDSPEGKALLAKWGIPDKFIGVGSLAIGYMEGDCPRAAARREGYVKIV